MNGEQKSFGIVERIVGEFRKYIFFKEEAYYYLCAIYTVMTNVYDVFDEIPYLLVFGSKGSGKSLLGDILGGLCFNGIFASDMTPAALYRVIDGNASTGTTIIMDEADSLSLNKSYDPLARILRSGYRRNGKVGRFDISKGVVWFRTFCPKIVINLEGFTDPALESRTIPIPMVKMETSLAKLRLLTAKAELKELREISASFSDEHRDEINDRYLSFGKVNGLLNRDEEVWTPILVIADVLDQTLPTPLLKDEILGLAKKIILQRKRTQLVGDLNAQILEATRAYVEKKEEAIKIRGARFFVGETLCNSIRDRWNISGLRVETVSRVLKRMDILKEIKRPRLRVAGTNTEVQKVCYSLDEEKLKSLTGDYFDGGDS